MEAQADPGIARRIVATTVAVVGTLVWTHAAAGTLRALVGRSVEELAPAATLLTVAAVVTALAGCSFATLLRATAAAAATGGAAAIAIGLAHRPALVPALALIPIGAVWAALGNRFGVRLPKALDRRATERPRLAATWVLVALVAIVQIGRLSTYMTDAETDWFLSTRHPFYAKHECFSAYIYGAELDRRGESNVYDAAHYPGLTRDAEPRTEMIGMTAEDPFQYAPQFLLWPRLAIDVTHDYAALRLLWFAVNVTLCMGTVLLLAAWVGGRAGIVAGLLTPLMLASFPVLHDFQYGQFHFAAIAFAVLALLAFARQRPALGGTLLAVSILSKLFPALLLVPLVVQRRWRDLAWTGAAGTALTLVALAVLGPAPFAAFFGYHLPRLGDGSAFAFGQAWPEMADLVLAGNQGIHGIVDKLSAMGVSWADTAASAVAGRLYAVVLLALGVAVGLRTIRAGRTERALAWLGLLGLGSLASTGAWADYVPLTCVWVLAWLAPLAGGRPLLQSALGACAVLQVFLLGTMPLGSLSGAAWMLPLSSIGAIAMLVTFGIAALTRVRAQSRVARQIEAWPEPLGAAREG